MSCLGWDKFCISSKGTGLRFDIYCYSPPVRYRKSMKFVRLVRDYRRDDSVYVADVTVESEPRLIDEISISESRSFEDTKVWISRNQKLISNIWNGGIGLAGSVNFSVGYSRKD